MSVVTLDVKVVKVMSLDPCFSGTYSLRRLEKDKEYKRMGVLILVLVEHTL